MPEFHLECEWKVRHIFHVEADTLEQAKEKVENAEPPYGILLVKHNINSYTVSVSDLKFDDGKLKLCRGNKSAWTTSDPQ